MANSLINTLSGLPDLAMGSFFSLFSPHSNEAKGAYLQRLQFCIDTWGDRNQNFFVLPDKAPVVKEFSVLPFFEGEEAILEFSSRYEKRIPMRQGTSRDYRLNDTATLYHWRHPAGKKRPLVFCLHGFMLGHVEAARKMFKVKKMFELGCDVVLYVLPYHGRRIENRMHQRLVCPDDIPMTLESMAQNMHDLHSAMLWCRQHYDDIGMIGASMGGYSLALYATLDTGARFHFYVVPAVDMHDHLAPKRSLFDFPITEELKALSARALDIVTPTTYRPLFNVHDMHVVWHAGDQLNDAHLTRQWVRDWKIEHYTDIPGGHWIYFDTKARGRVWYAWLEKYGFLSGSSLHE